MKCKVCGYEEKDKGRAKGGRTRWHGTKKKDRVAEMRKVRAAGVKGDAK